MAPICCIMEVFKPWASQFWSLKIVYDRLNCCDHYFGTYLSLTISNYNPFNSSEMWVLHELDFQNRKYVEQWSSKVIVFVKFLQSVTEHLSILSLKSKSLFCFYSSTGNFSWRTKYKKCRRYVWYYKIYFFALSHHIRAVYSRENKARLT